MDIDVDVPGVIRQCLGRPNMLREGMYIVEHLVRGVFLAGAGNDNGDANGVDDNREGESDMTGWGLRLSSTGVIRPLDSFSGSWPGNSERRLTRDATTPRGLLVAVRKLLCIAQPTRRWDAQRGFLYTPWRLSLSWSTVGAKQVRASTACTGSPAGLSRPRRLSRSATNWSC